MEHGSKGFEEEDAKESSVPHLQGPRKGGDTMVEGRRFGGGGGLINLESRLK